MRIAKSLMMAALAGAAAPASAVCLDTLYATGNSGSAGGMVYFDVIVGASPITITGFDVNTLATAGTTFGFQAYTHTGTYVGTTTSSVGWTQQATGTGVAAGTNLHSTVTLSNPIVLSPGTTYAFALSLGAQGAGIAASHAYTNGTGANQLYSNADLTISLGAASNVPFTGAPFTPRVWNGTICYSLGGTLGACCKADGSCVSTTSAGCTAQGGTYQGDNTLCNQVNCPQPPNGACCKTDGSCADISTFACATAGGVWGGATSSCATTVCPLPGACCKLDQTCSSTVPAACAAVNGVFQGAGVLCSAVNCPAPNVFYSNCNIKTGTATLSGVGGLPAGSEWSECARDEVDPFSGNTVAGFTGTGALRLADDFVVPAGGLTVGYIRAYAYLTGAAAPGVTSANIQIWNGAPNAGGAVVFGDTTTNRLALNSFAPIYRCFPTTVPVTGCAAGGTAPDQTRHLQYIYIKVNQFLPAGTYWIDINYTGASFSPPNVQADAIGRQCNPNNSNAIQFNAAWVAMADTGQGCVLASVNQDLFFDVIGSVPSSCYPNCDHSTVAPCLNVQDFSCFLNSFANGETYANCDNSTIPPVLNVQDFSCFLNSFANGCSSC